MTNFMHELFRIVLSTFIFCVMALLFFGGTETLHDTRVALNAVENYIDIVTDKGELNDKDYEEFLLDLAQTGLDFDVTLIREQRLVYKKEVVYTPTTVVNKNIGDLNTPVKCKKGDEIKVTIEATNSGRASSALKSITGIGNPKIDFSLSGAVRN